MSRNKWGHLPKLWVAADSDDDPQTSLRKLVIDDRIDRLLTNAPGRVGIKFETFLRQVGYDGMRDVYHRLAGRMQLFLDGKLSGLPSTLSRDGACLETCFASVATVMCGDDADTHALVALKRAAPSVCILGVVVLTSKKPDIPEVVQGAMRAEKAGLDGLIVPGYALVEVRKRFPDLYLVVPGIRDDVTLVRKDDHDEQSKIGLEAAFTQGADSVVIGRPIIQAADPAKIYRAMLRKISR